MTQARNPWLDITEVEYVGHMNSPAVDQHPVLNRLLRDALAATLPHAVLVLGCSTGNGLEHVDAAVTRRVTAVDINPLYLQRLVERFPNPGFALDVRCADLAAYTFEPEAFDPGWTRTVRGSDDPPAMLMRALGVQPVVDVAAVAARYGDADLRAATGC